MNKLPNIISKDLMFPISVCSLSSFLEFSPLRVNCTSERINKINRVLQNSLGSKIILFPEYTYSEELNPIFQNYCDANECIIIGGSGLEATSNNQFYAFCPVFVPQEEIFKVYKKNIIPLERTLSKGALIPYPDEIERTVKFHTDEDGRDYTFSVYVCSDFLYENKEKRSDIFFVPQYENSPALFLMHGHESCSGHKNFVIGANNADNDNRSYGFGVLNGSIIEGLTLNHFRRPAYNDDEGRPQLYHPSLIYGISGEKVVKMALNIGRPYSLSLDFHFGGMEPVVIPRGITEL